MNKALPFQYTQRAEAIERLRDVPRIAVIEQRDRELEDHLAAIDARLADIEARLAALEGP